MIIDKYLYFRTVTDEDNDDSSADSVYVPVRNITGVTPTSATALTIFFKSVNNEFGNFDDEDVINDSVIVNFTAGKGKQVMQNIVSSITSGKLNGDGRIIVADDVTTNLANATVDAITLSPHITSCGAISIAAAL
tara:strand:+ start:709 stop:1113 length:405 start_codon:yes stop_codon:yes gene_type:complete